MKKSLLGYSLILAFLSSLLHPGAVQAEPVIESAYDIIIDVGHGGIDGGTSVEGVLEKDINLEIGIKLFQALKQKEFKVGITRIHDYALSDDSPFQHIRSRHKRDLKQRALIAESLHPRLFISLHVNWSKNKNSRGPLVIFQPNEASYHLAKIVQSHLNKYYDLQKTPQKGKTYFLMKQLQMPSIIVELGFLSNEQDFAILTREHTQNQLVNRLVHALEEYLLISPGDIEQETVDSVAKDRFYYESRGEVVWDVPINEKVICLTFDDGPHPTYTPQILDLLQTYEAKATFFVAGKQVNKNPELVQRQVLEGHVINNIKIN